MPHVRPLLTALSALLLGAVVLLWARSPHHADIFAFRSPGGFLQGVASERGGILLFFSKVPIDGEFGPSDEEGRERVRHWAALSVPAGDFQMLHDELFGPTTHSFSKWGFRAATGALTWYMPGPIYPTYRAIVVPDWILVLLLLPLPSGWTRRTVRTWYRARKGLCRSCGYDLRATSSGCCPECGAKLPVRQPGAMA